MRLALLLMVACGAEPACEVLVPAASWDDVECQEVQVCEDAAGVYLMADTDGDGSPEQWDCPLGECAAELDLLEPYICEATQ